MRRRGMLGGVLAGLACGAEAGWAATADGATLPDRYAFEGRELLLNGMGVRRLTFLRIRAYSAGLYLVRRGGDAEGILRSAEPKGLLLQFLHGASKSQVEEQFRDGEAASCRVPGAGCTPGYRSEFARLIAATPAVSVGDTLAYSFRPDRVRAYAGGRLLGEFANEELSRRLLSGFIGPEALGVELRAGLLGG